VVCPVPQYFSTLLYKRHDFLNKPLTIRLCLWFSLQRLSETFYIPRELSETRSKHILLFMPRTRYSCPIWMKLEFSRQIFENYRNVNILFYSNIKLHENWFSGCRVVPCGGQAYGQTDMTNLIEDIRNFATTPKSNDSHHNMRCIHKHSRCHQCSCRFNTIQKRKWKPNVQSTISWKLFTCTCWLTWPDRGETH
jgi:hypothetical protein